MFWKPSPALTLSTDAIAASSISEVDFVEEFGIEDKMFPEFRAVVGRGYIAPMVSIGGEFSGLKLGREEVDIKFFDFDINGIVSIGRHVGAQVGYRSVIADYIVDEDTGDLKMKGPYFGGVVRF